MEEEKSKPQLRELLTNYGPLGLVWFDRGIDTPRQAAEFVKLVRTLQPQCLINGRMMEKEPGLIGGKWFGGNNSAYTGSNAALLPCYVDITLPKKRFVSHVVIGETVA